MVEAVKLVCFLHFKVGSTSFFLILDISTEDHVLSASSLNSINFKSQLTRGLPRLAQNPRIYDRKGLKFDRKVWNSTYLLMVISCFASNLSCIPVHVFIINLYNLGQWTFSVLFFMVVTSAFFFIGFVLVREKSIMTGLLHCHARSEISDSFDNWKHILW